MNNEKVSLAVVEARMKKFNEYHRKYNAEYRKTHAKEVSAYNSRYWKRQRLILKLLTQNPKMTFEEARANAFEQVPTPNASKEKALD